jgi:hypothetical protein
MMDIKDRRKAQGIRRKGVEFCSLDAGYKRPAQGSGHKA